MNFSEGFDERSHQAKREHEEKSKFGSNSDTVLSIQLRDLSVVHFSQLTARQPYRRPTDYLFVPLPDQIQPNDRKT